MSNEQISGGIDEQSEAMEEVTASAQQLAAMSDKSHERIDLFKLDSDENANLDADPIG